ncbi:MAG TPA: class II glutamine amidotransferase [Streptosporangiaceae bacterium]|nr:class II glutamine amidotransferase [Streptosporangiaceae bacterium]
MCRLLGLTAGSEPVVATFWLLDAPDSLEVQSRRNADGSGIGFFDPAGAPVLDKQPEPAFRDPDFIREAKQAESAVFVAHVRLATAGGRSVRNTHPFTMHGRIMAHNGGFGEVQRLEEQLGSYRELVLGDTDSERYFALITQQTEAHGGDVGAGIAAAARWIGARLPVSSLNTVVAAPGELWALRYPGQHALHIIERPAGASAPAGTASGAATGTVADGTVADGTGRSGLHARSTTSSVHAPALQALPSVVVASEELDGERGWRMLASGELIHVRQDLTVESAVVIPEPPAHLVPLPAGSPNIDT